MGDAICSTYCQKRGHDSSHHRDFANQLDGMRQHVAHELGPDSLLFQRIDRALRSYDVEQMAEAVNAYVRQFPTRADEREEG